MKRNLVRRETKTVRKLPAAPAAVAQAQPDGWLSFSYSHREVSLSGGKTRLRSREYRFANGRLESEEFDGTLDASVYRTAVLRAQELMLAQTKSLLGLFSAFLPFKGGEKK
ncbi:MAG TPA: hypothetical protein VKF40_24940 [Burkholderiales bacterium]|nr:hypothetical protein [Burkholderiales bacterium]